MRNFADMLRNKKKTMDNTEEQANKAAQHDQNAKAGNVNESTDLKDLIKELSLEELENPELFEAGAEGAAESTESEEEAEKLLSPEQKLQKQVERLTGQLTESNDKYLRMVAEFDNFRKRTSKERMDLFKTAGKDVLVSIIPVMDDFERAEKALAKATDVQSVKDGLAIVAGKLKGILSQQGLKEMKSIGEAFDTDRHEAITNVPAPSPDMKGKVLDEVEKGYFLNDKVIRFAKVIIGE